MLESFQTHQDRLSRWSHTCGRIWNRCRSGLRQSYAWYGGAMRDNLLLSDPKAVGIRCEGLRMRSKRMSRSVAPIGIFHRKSALRSMLEERTVTLRICDGCLLCRTLRILRVVSLSLDRMFRPQAAASRTIRSLEVVRSDGINLCQTFRTLEPLGADGILLCRTLEYLI